LKTIADRLPAIPTHPAHAWALKSGFSSQSRWGSRCVKQRPQGFCWGGREKSSFPTRRTFLPPARGVPRLWRQLRLPTIRRSYPCRGTITTNGLDISKSVFQVSWGDGAGPPPPGINPARQVERGDGSVLALCQKLPPVAWLWALRPGRFGAPLVAELGSAGSQRWRLIPPALCCEGLKSSGQEELHAAGTARRQFARRAPPPGANMRFVPNQGSRRSRVAWFAHRNAPYGLSVSRPAGDKCNSGPSC